MVLARRWLGLNVKACCRSDSMDGGIQDFAISSIKSGFVHFRSLYTLREHIRIVNGRIFHCRDFCREHSLKIDPNPAKFLRIAGLSMLRNSLLDHAVAHPVAIVPSACR